MTAFSWQNRRIPPGVAAVLDALRFRDPDAAALRCMPETEWPRALSFADRAQLTLALGHLYREAFPGGIRERVERSLEHNRTRTRCLRETFGQVAAGLRGDGIRAVVLKGFAHWADYVPAPELRVQYDLDLFCPHAAPAAHETLRRLGYEPVEEMKDFPTDHLPTLIRKTGWQWRGDYFDPEMPYAVDLHFRLWDEATERLSAPGLEAFAERQVELFLGDQAFLGLHRADALGYAALHVLRHLLRGSLRPAHVHELAFFLHARRSDDAFWDEWHVLHGPALRRLEAVPFRLAAEWFHCALHDAPAEAIDGLPRGVAHWFEEHAAAPLEALFRPNKEELWLHLSLVESSRDRRNIFVRRMLPARLPGPVDSVHVRKEQLTWKLRLRARWRYAAYLTSRAAFHLRCAPAVFLHGAAWWWNMADLGRPYWTFFGAAALFNSGVFLFVLLYNLLLLDRGLQEDLLGSISTAMTVGSIAGTLPAGRLVERVGLRRALAFCFIGGAVAFTARVLVHGSAALLGTAFLSGGVLAVWAITIAPVVAALTTERNRPLGFSLMMAAGMGTGVVAGLLGGRLPVWLAGLGPPAAKETSILLGCALCPIAVWPVLRLQLPKPAGPQRTKYIWSPFLLRFLVAMAVWNLATGSFNPFFNAYLSRFQHFPVTRVGMLFSGGQLAQVAAVLLAPILLRRWGLMGGIGMMQMGAGAALACLAFPSAAAGVVAYVLYVSFQWMSEPGMNTVLMNNVAPEARAGASALNYLVIFSAQALASAIAGWTIARSGYPPVLMTAGSLCLLAGVLFWKWIRP